MHAFILKHFKLIFITYSMTTGRNVPCWNTEMFHNAEDNQRIIPIDIYEGLSDRVRDNKFLDSIHIAITPKPAGTNKVEVKFKMSKTHLLEVTAFDKENPLEKKAKSIDWATNIISKKQLTKQKRDLQKIRNERYLNKIVKENKQTEEIESNELENWIKQIDITELSYDDLHTKYINFKKKQFIKNEKKKKKFKTI